MDIHSFSSDRPIKNIEEDLLGRASFSKDLAKAITSWHGNDSLVVALHGEWGSGKSSIKNMAISDLEKNNKKVDIIEFTPWEWAAQEQITSSFFKEISSTIGLKDKSVNGKRLSSILKKYGRYLHATETFVTGLSSALPSLFVLVSILGLGGIFLEFPLIQQLAPIGIALALMVAASLKWGRSILNIFEEGIRTSAKDNELSLRQLRNELKVVLSERENLLLVVMDDLDRLNSEELRMVFQLVKANTEFPNFVFLLLFQRDLVEEKLNDGKQSGRDYLEKIIQVPFDIPKIEDQRSHEVLFKNINEILAKNNTVKDMFDNGYWGNIFLSSLSYYFTNLRSVYRFTSTLSFQFSLFKGDSTFEVNPVDLIAMECLRMFEPDVYHEISKSKELLTNSHILHHNINEERVSFFETINIKSTKGKSKYVTKLLHTLFPTLNGTMYDGSYSRDWLKSLRICHSKNFDKYYELTIPRGEISKSDLQKMLEMTGDSDVFSEHLSSLNKRGELRNALSLFESYVDEIPLENSESFIKSMLIVGDDVDDETEGFASLSTSSLLGLIVKAFLIRIDDIGVRSENLLDYFIDSNGMKIIEGILQSEENNREKPTNSNILRDAEFEKLKLEFVRKLDELREHSPLKILKSVHLHSYLYRWNRWGNSSELCNWLSDMVSDPERCLDLLKAFITKSSISGSDDYVTRISKSINLKHIETFIPVEEINDVLIKIDKSSLSSDNIEIINIFNRAMQRRKDGQEKYDW